MVKWRWLCTRCRRCVYYCCLCTVSLAVLLAVSGSVGVNRWVLDSAGLVHGDEMAADIPLESQGKLHFSQNEDQQQDNPPPAAQHTPHSEPPSLLLPSHEPNREHLHCSLHSKVKILFFIRLPKCASTSFVEFLQKLSKKLHFYLEFNPSGAYNWKEVETISIAQQISRIRLLKRNIVYAGHFYFINFAKYEIKDFTYITIMRDPVDRVVSSYLYYHFSSKPHIQDILNPKHRDESLSTCVKNQHEGCTHNLVTKYFCGHDYWCKYGDSHALETAKKNLVNNFAIVGIVEEMELSIKLMRRLLPRYFKTGNMDDLTLLSLNKNERTASLSQEERREIAEANSADVELYNFAVELLYDKADDCGLRV